MLVGVVGMAISRLRTVSTNASKLFILFPASFARHAKLATGQHSVFCRAKQICVNQVFLYGTTQPSLSFGKFSQGPLGNFHAALLVSGIPKCRDLVLRSPQEAVSVLYSHAFLRLWPSEHSEMSEDAG